MKSEKVALAHLAIGIDSQVTYHVVAMEKVAKKCTLTKRSNRNTLQVTSDLLNSISKYLLLSYAMSRSAILPCYS